jgi:hypothetical protein
MIKSEIRSVIKNLLPKYEEIERYHPRFIDACIERAMTEYYNLIFLRDPKELERYTKQFGYTSAIGVSSEPTTGLYYSNYPTMVDGTNVTTVPIPDKASGVRRISTMIQGGASFYPMDAREMDLIMSGSYTNTMTAKIGYCPRRTRVDYYHLTAAVILAGVRMDLLIPFSKYEETDTVLVPELMNDQGMGFTDRVLQILKEVQPVELYENKTFEETKK